MQRYKVVNMWNVEKNVKLLCLNKLENICLQNFFSGKVNLFLMSTASLVWQFNWRLVLLDNQSFFLMPTYKWTQFVKVLILFSWLMVKQDVYLTRATFQTDAVRNSKSQQQQFILYLNLYHPQYALCTHPSFNLAICCLND